MSKAKTIGPARFNQIAPHYFGCYALDGDEEMIWGLRLKDETPYEEIANLALFNGHTVVVTVDEAGGISFEDVHGH